MRGGEQNHFHKCARKRGTDGDMFLWLHAAKGMLTMTLTAVLISAVSCVAHTPSASCEESMWWKNDPWIFQHHTHLHYLPASKAAPILIAGQLGYHLLPSINPLSLTSPLSLPYLSMWPSTILPHPSSLQAWGVVTGHDDRGSSSEVAWHLNTRFNTTIVVHSTDLSSGRVEIFTNTYLRAWWPYYTTSEPSPCSKVGVLQPRGWRGISVMLLLSALIYLLRWGLFMVQSDPGRFQFNSELIHILK